jgi:hypothetical protein
MAKVLLVASSLLCLAALQSAALPQLAHAAIVCKDGFQRSGGAWISTPYCNDAHLAQIARNRGVRVSDAEVRNNPNKKSEICRFLNSSPTARDYCPDERSGSRGR